MRGFDSSFILHALYDLGYKVVKVLSVGAKYLSFECSNLIFRDSLNFFNMALEKLPATFNLQELHKGFFPYSWIHEDKYEYMGPYPPAEDYHPERMSEKRRKEFYAWHKEKVESNAVFDFQKELSAYLHSDVEVLAQSLEAFAEEMVELTGINYDCQYSQQSVEKELSNSRPDCLGTQKRLEIKPAKSKRAVKNL